ncbi:MAG: hypothetical protein CO189_06560 [candidate division Zixibacteria bacterium CG_4_9_14_3_um_filter_46_8]|nr:MAG: hypothetical protein CO189_06560 [candidate division Zixibacteria bacterium CG_4_9_14_3_um_filter_46_8]
MGFRHKPWGSLVGLTVGWILSSASMLWAVDRMVVGELVTNTGCVYCFFADNELDRLFPLYPENLILIRYHRSSPDSQDPYYQFNPEQNMQRILFYGMSGTPRFFVDGTYSNYFTDYEDSILSRMPVPSPLSISLTGSLDQVDGSGFINVAIDAIDEMPSYPVNVRVAVTESNLYYHAPNATFWHHQTFRGMLPDTEGDTLTMSAGSQYYFSYDFDFEDLGLVLENCQFVAFVQDDFTKEIYQGAKLNLVAMPNVGRVDVEIRPHLPEIIIPRSGGSFSYTGNLTNNVALLDSIDVWQMLTFPNGSEMGPLGNYIIPVGALGQFSDSNIVQEIPWNAPSGIYVYRCYAGNYPDDIQDSSRLEFRKECGVAGGTYSNYSICGWTRPGNNRMAADIGKAFDLTCSPNPCNPYSEIAFFLEESEFVRVEIINIMGEIIDVLIEGIKPAGNNSIIWNGSAYSSGIYFASLKVGSASSCAKIVLLK